MVVSLSLSTRPNYTTMDLIVLSLFLVFTPLLLAQSLTNGSCEIGWTLWSGNCYRAVDTKSLGIDPETVNFGTANAYCRSNGADLASITSAFEDSFLSGLASIPGFRYWIGLQISSNGNISWIDGTPYSYSNLNLSTITNGQVLSAYYTPGKQWVAAPAATVLEGRICKKPSNPSIPAFRNGSALGYWSTHDPTIIKDQDGQYVVYFTDYNIPVSISSDEQTFFRNGSAFPNGLPWIRNYTAGTTRCNYADFARSKATETDCAWCPDAHYVNGQYYMYYAASTLGSKVSGMFLATSVTGRSGNWTNMGEVFNSKASSFNAIDPSLMVDDDGTWYMSFGSWSSGIWQYIMDSSTGFVKQGEQPVHLANDRPTGIEGSCLWKNGKYYYLAASLGHCCFGLQSTYRVVYGRSTNPRGPFVDKAGTNLLNGGGSELIVTHFPMIGPGNGFVYKGQPGENRDIYAYHYYDGLNGGHARLSINYMQYTDDGWPYLY